MKKALVLSLAVILGLGFASFAQTLTGSWNTTVKITPTPVVTLGITSNLVVTYSVSGWSFTSTSTVKETGWTAQKFDVTGSLGAFTIGSNLMFTPAPPAFLQWVTTAGVSLAGVTFDFKFVSVPADTAIVLKATGTAGNVNVAATLQLGSAVQDSTTGLWSAHQTNSDQCGFDFNNIVIKVDFPFCCANVFSEIKFTCDGFQYVDFGVKGIAIPNLPWLALDAKIHFTMTSKELTLTPKFNFGVITCFTLYITEAKSGGIGPTSPLVLGDFSVNGIGLDCTIAGVQFTGISFWGTGDKPGLLYGTGYWEAYRIKTTDDGCCGPFAFDITAYFKSTSVQLFDVSKLVANMSIQIATQFTFTMGISVDLDAAPATFTEWTLGFKVVW
jgi:hypothetical protein